MVGVLIAAGRKANQGIAFLRIRKIQSQHQERKRDEPLLPVDDIHFPPVRILFVYDDRADAIPEFFVAGSLAVRYRVVYVIQQSGDIFARPSVRALIRRNLQLLPEKFVDAYNSGNDFFHDFLPLSESLVCASALRLMALPFPATTLPETTDVIISISPEYVNINRTYSIP